MYYLVYIIIYAKSRKKLYHMYVYELLKLWVVIQDNPGFLVFIHFRISITNRLNAFG